MKADFTVVKDRLRVKTPYSPVLVDRFRLIPGRLFDGKELGWSFPMVRDVLLMVADAVGVLPSMLPADASRLCEDSGVEAAKDVDLALVEGHSFLTEPYEHQRANLARLLAEDRWLLADEMGTGKTHAVVNRLTTLETHAPGSDILILCPKSVVRGWVQELMLHGKLFGTIVQGDRKERARIIESPGIKVANYELLLHSDFAVIPWDVVVLDEVHRVKTFTAATSRKVRSLTGNARMVYALSGTPAPNGLEDWHGVLAAVKPDLVPTTKTAFQNRYCVTQEIAPRAWKVVGYRNVQELHAKIASISSRVIKAECLDLPDKVFLDRWVKLEGEQARVYRDLRRDAVARLKTAKGEGQLTLRNVLSEALRLLQVAGGHFPMDDGTVQALAPSAKLTALRELIEDLGDKQAVIWCAFKAEVSQIATMLGKDAVEFTGDTSAKERTEALEIFRTGDVRYFVGTASAGGTGVNGLQVSDVEIYFSRNYNLAEFLQSQDRCHRVGMGKNNLSIIKLLAENTVDCKVDQALDKKRDLQDLMLSDPEDML